MKPERIKELRELADAATPGPWTVDKDLNGFPFVDSEKLNVCFFDEDFSATEDAKFIASARTAIPELLDYIEKLEAVREAAKGLFGKLNPAIRKSDTTYPGDELFAALRVAEGEK